MKEDLISFETAKLAKEKGFDEICYYLHHPEYGIIENSKYHKNSKININSLDKTKYITALTQSLLQKWLREKHKILVLPVNDLPLPNNSWACSLEYISPAKTKHTVKVIVYPRFNKGMEEAGTYEEALERGLYKALLLIKS